MKNRTSPALIEAPITAAIGAELHGLHLTDPSAEGVGTSTRHRACDIHVPPRRVMRRGVTAATPPVGFGGEHG